MEAPSEDDASTAPQTAPTCSQDASASNATSEASNKALDPTQLPSQSSDTTDTKLSLLERQLEREMQKRRPDHFVIGVTCRSLGEVPSALRSQVWKELLGVARSERLYLDQSILQVEEDLDNQRVIAADASRTRGNEPRFQQPETVELVVKLLTYYCKCRSIRYKQGMNEVLAPFLLLTERREGSEESVPLAEGVVFQCFYALIDKFLPHVFVDKEFRSLQCSFQLYRLLMLYHDPELCQYLDQHDMTPELYVTPWFMTLFARSLPPEFVFYLWDFFLLEEDPYLLHFVAYALVAANRGKVFEADIAMLPQVLSSLTFSSRDELEQVCSSALAISESTPRSFKRDLYSVCYGGFTDAMVPFLDQLYACSSLQVYPEELVRNLLDRLATKRTSVLAPAAVAIQEELTSADGSLDPLLSPNDTQAPQLYPSGSDDGEEAVALKFIVLDCRPVEEYHKSHLSLSHHIDPSIMERPDALDGLIKGFSHMKGCHFCFVGPSVDSTPALPRSLSNNGALNTIVRLARVISNDKSAHESVQKTIEVTVAAEVAGGTLLSSAPPIEPVTLSRKQSPGEPGALASEIGSNGASKVHAEHVSVTRLVQLFLQKEFKYVSRLDGGFDELEKNIRSMDAFAQEQLLVSSPLPPPSSEEVTVSPESSGSSSAGSFNLLAKIGLSRSRAPSQDDFVAEVTTSVRSDVSESSSRSTTVSVTTVASASSSSAKEVKKKTKITTSSAVSTLSQRLMLLKAAAKDVVSSTSSSLARTNSNASAEANEVEETHTESDEGWVEVRLKTDEPAEKSGGKTTDVELQPGPIGILFQKSTTSKIFQAVVDSVVPDSQASATGLINTGDLLVAINGESLEDVAFLTVIERVIEASRPVVLRFLTPLSTQKDKTATVSDIPPLAPTLVSSTRHSICITWDKLPVSVAPSTVARYQLQFAKQSGDDFNPWLQVSMKQEGTTAEVDTTGVTDQTNGTMVGLEPGESLVFRVRCGDGQRWGPYSLSSGSMRTQAAGESSATSGTVTPTAVDQESLTTAVFLPGVCPEYVERGRFFYRVLLALRARRRPDFNAEKLDIVLERGLVIRGSERLVCPGSNQIFVRLAFGEIDDVAGQDREFEGAGGELMLLRNGQREADDDADGIWAFENTPDGDVVLERIPESTVEAAGPSLQEQAKSMVQSFLNSSGINSASATSGNLGDNTNSNSAGSISSMGSTAASTSSGNSAPVSSHSPVAPRVLQVFAASSSDIVVTWDPVNDVGVTKYQIQYVKDRLASMWWTVKPDIDADTLKFSVSGLQPNTPYLFRVRSGTDDKWSPYSESSESCRTLQSGKVSANNSSGDEDEKTSVTRRPSNSNGKAPTSQAPMRTGSILDKAVAVASRLRRRSNSSNNHQAESQPDEAPLNNKEDDDEAQQHEDEKEDALELPSSREVNLASWKSSPSDAHKDFRFYHATKFEEQDEDSHRQLSRLGDRELVVTPSMLVVLNVMASSREGFARVEEWRSLASLTQVAEREDLENALVFRFKDQSETKPDSTDDMHQSDQLIVVVDGAKTCADVVQKYHAQVLEG